ncbi:serine/threonine-protein kinase [Streptomyces zagrosensis]|uniref:non-specific serine/threonine protein kinase n=1 Tax=Streptomyces zagrosensis TaxID=1042984 RepID=A0A7W9QGK1_9ACTN|nr:serine/threonine-protein kinase [Streptomyces zagrosensis]MBB5939624.1 tRNA A-37 threonylcarbamoyl transferase component Bud32 [Streptomyces zagrosensis]
MSEAEQTQGKTGRLLAGRYRLGEVLGRGGMGTVWRARDETLGRTVAVKELRFPSSVDEDEKRRLITRTLREAKAIARIRSSGAVTVYDVVDEDDRPWIVMELIEGRSLADVVRDDGALSPRRAAEVGLAVLDVLRAAHREGILHRDVKPSNVLIADDGRVVLTDFGIAQVEGDPSVTSTGMLVGAPSYIAPERARGHKPGPPSDLWSLGGLLYAAVEGVPPYDKSTAIATLTAVMTEALDPPKNAGVLEEVIYGLLAKDPARRLDDAGARAMLTAAVNAPDDRIARPAAPMEPTRTMPLPSAPGPVAPHTTRPVHRSEAAGSARPAGRPSGLLGGGRSTGRTAGVAGSAGGGGARSAPHSDATTPPRPHGVPGAPPASVRGGGSRASITDVVPKRTLVIVVVVVLLAVLGTAIALALSGEGDKGEQSKSGARASASSGATGDDTATGDDEGKTGDGDAGDQSSAQPTGGQNSADQDDKTDKDSKDSKGDKKNSGVPAGIPQGYEPVSDGKFHFAMTLPKGWERRPIPGYSGGGVYSASGGFPRVQVDFNAKPLPNAAEAWRGAEPGASRTMKGYRGLGIHAVTDWKGYPTVADWNFERDQRGKTVRVLNRGFKVDAKRGYAVMITCEKGAWAERECRTLREVALRSFAPKE